MRRTADRALAAVAVAVAAAGSALVTARPALAAAGHFRTGETAASAAVSAALAVAPRLPAPASGLAANRTSASRPASAGVPRHVVLVGIGGLRWSDVSPLASPALWRLAEHGAIGSLLVSGVNARTCPADGWLTLNGAARAVVAPDATGPCPALPAVVARAAPRAPGGRGPGREPSPEQARVPAMPALAAANVAYDPDWGLLARAPATTGRARAARSGHVRDAGRPLSGPASGAAGCATAAGPGAALALATRAGLVPRYVPAPSGLTGAELTRCPLTVVDLGNLPPAGRTVRIARAATSRSAALRAADRGLAALTAHLPPRSTLIVAATGGAATDLRVLVVSGPGYRGGLLTTTSTRQTGLVLLTDLTPAVFNLLGAAPSASTPNSAPNVVLRTGPRAGLASAVALLRSQDTAEQVFRTSSGPFFYLLGFGLPVLFALIWAVPLGHGGRRGRRRAVARAAGLWAAGLPAGTYLASLAPWPAAAHPAAVLYSLAAAAAAAVAALALAGPWRRDPLGAAGAVAAVTFTVIGLDLLTGSHLSLETPFGNFLPAGRYYGLDDSSVVIYAASGILTATWAGSALLRRGRRAGALGAMGAIAAVAVAVAAWPTFGAKVGGTIAMVPGFLVVIAATAEVRITPRRAALIAVSGLATVVLVALISYSLPVAGQSDITAFVGKSLHGGASAILRRKISTNLSSLTASPFSPAVPPALVLLGVALAWPDRLRLPGLARACRDVPRLKAALLAIWIAAVLGWFTEDYGVAVAAAGFPMLGPLGVAIVSALPERAPEAPRNGTREADGGRAAAGRARYL